MSPDRLIYMANQIGKFFQSQAQDRAVPGIAEHIRKFWDPRMRKAIIAHLEQAAPDWIPTCGMPRVAEEGLEALIAALDDLAKHPPHLGLSLPQPGLRRGKIRRVASARHHPQQIFARRFRLEFLADAKPQNLREIMIEPRGRAQHLGGRLRQNAQPGGVIPHLYAWRHRAVRVCGGMRGLQVWAMKSISTMPPATYFRSQISASPFSSAMARRISATSVAMLARSRRRIRTSRMARSIRVAKVAPTPRSPGPGKRHVLPGPGLVILVFGEGIEPRRQRACPARRRNRISTS